MHETLDRRDATADDLVAALGLRRVDRIRVLVGQGRARAEVTGIARRFPRTLRISLEQATRLAAAGVPMRIEHRSGTVLSGRH